MTTTLNRSDIQRGITTDDKCVRGLESLFKAVADTSSAVTAGADATQGITNATVVVLSPNDAFANDRILAVSGPLAIQDNGAGGTVVIGFQFPFVVNGGYALTLNMQADTNLILPTTGTVISDSTLPAFVYPGPFASDADAATGGVPVNGIYRATGGTVKWRQA